MSGGSRIVAVEPGGEAPSQAGEHSLSGRSPEGSTVEESPETTEDDLSGPSLRDWIAPALAVVSVLAWTGFFAWAQSARFASGVTPQEGVRLVSDWSIPVLLVCAVWLLFMRTSRRESARFGNVAHRLGVESARLEQRLTTINRELSLAREFIASQSRDLESLGRVAGERLSEHADRLQSLIKDNGKQVDVIATVSVTALDNLERLRGQLPVITSSGKDVANTIANAGRVAQSALAELIEGFDRLTASGQAGTSEIAGLQTRMDESLGLFESRLEQIHAVVSGRLEQLEHRGTELRERLGASEADALAALDKRATTLADHVDRTRAQLESQEAEALTSLRARLAALRDEGTALARSLREGETGALEALLAAKTRVEAEITDVVMRLDKLDRDALEAASRRIQQLSAEAGEFDTRLAERNAQFTSELERRLAQAAERHEGEVARLESLFARLDTDMRQRQERQATAQRDLATQSEAIAARLESLSDRIAAIAAFGNKTEETLGNGLVKLADRLTASRDALSGTDAAVAQLTDGAVRLLELLQASSKQSREDLPEALRASDATLVEWERRVADLRTVVSQAGENGDALARTAAETRATLESTLGELTRMQEQFDAGADRHSGKLGEIRIALEDLTRESSTLAEQASAELTSAIEHLGIAARSAVAALEQDSAGAVAKLADRLGEESSAAIDRAMRVRMAEAVGALEQAAGHAAGVSREAALQLRDQLAKVDELTGNLEQRVAHARTRAEEQVDNDFSRRVALITESLNSNAIDIAKALSTEVTDTAWAAYLRGDRGVFTRRALKLVDTAEAREIVRLFEDDFEFRDHVSRYIHDFEAMLRQLLSTRDGHALGVTLLSSDMGKLYVVLAQAIERLRT